MLNSEGELLGKRITLQHLLDMYFAFDDDKFKQDFLNACLVMDTAKKLGHYQQSASYVFLVSALETLIELEHRNTEIATCKCCGQKQYQVLAKFRDFIDKYGWNIDNKTKNDFYKMRSEISHAGKLFQSSYRRNFFPTSQEDMDEIHKALIEDNKHRLFRGLVEVCFASFLFWNMQPKAPE